jgi:hypothetical protein
LGRENVHITAEILLLKCLHQQGAKFFERQVTASFSGDLHDVLCSQQKLPLGQPVLFGKVKLELAVEGQMERVVGYGSWVLISFLYIHIIMKSNTTTGSQLTLTFKKNMTFATTLCSFPTKNHESYIDKS